MGLGWKQYTQRIQQQSLEDIFITSVVNLQLFSAKASGGTVILWQNPSP